MANTFISPQRITADFLRIMQNNAALAPGKIGATINLCRPSRFTGNQMLSTTVLAHEACMLLDRGLAGHRLRAAHEGNLVALPRPISAMLSESVSVYYSEADRLLTIDRFADKFFAMPLRQMADGIADSSRGRRVVFWDIQLPPHCDFAERVVNPVSGLSLLIAGIYDVREDRMLLKMATQFSLVN